MNVKAGIASGSTEPHNNKRRDPPPKISAPFKIKIRPSIDEILLILENKQSPPSNLTGTCHDPNNKGILEMITAKASWSFPVLSNCVRSSPWTSVPRFGVKSVTLVALFRNARGLG
jgi:hypothetical protein